MSGAGPGNLNSATRVDTALFGENIAGDDRSNNEQKATPHALSGIQGEGGVGRRPRRQDAGRIGVAT